MASSWRMVCSLCRRKSKEARALILQLAAITFFERGLLFWRHGQFQFLSRLQFKRDEAGDDGICLHLRIYVRRIGDGVGSHAENFCARLLNGGGIVLAGHAPFAKSLPDRSTQDENDDEEDKYFCQIHINEFYIECLDRLKA
jgi:hypothetical protein